MAGFRKAQPKQAAVKASMYGPPGSGKTLTALLFAEGIAKVIGKRIAVIDTERGTDFYAMPIPARTIHPDAFDFDAIYTRSLTEANKACRDLDPKEHGIILVDSVSHLWDTAIASYSGPKVGGGKIPMWAWGKIKAPYKELMKFLIDSPFHIFILGRQANVFEENDSGETKSAGVKMRAEGETAYEPHMCIRMIPQRTEETVNARGDKKTVVLREQTITAFGEKDRASILTGKSFPWPTYETVIAPIMGLLNGVQGATPSDEDAVAQDTEANASSERNKASRSQEIRDRFVAKVQLAETATELAELNSKLTPELKKAMSALHQTECKTAWLEKDNLFKGKTAPQPAREPGDDTEAAA